MIIVIDMDKAVAKAKAKVYQIRQRLTIWALQKEKDQMEQELRRKAEQEAERLAERERWKEEDRQRDAEWAEFEARVRSRFGEKEETGSGP